MVNKVLERKSTSNKQYISIRCVSGLLSTFLMIVWNELRDEKKLQIESIYTSIIYKTIANSGLLRLNQSQSYTFVSCNSHFSKKSKKTIFQNLMPFCLITTFYIYSVLKTSNLFLSWDHNWWSLISIFDLISKLKSYDMNILWTVRMFCSAFDRLEYYL